MITTALDAYKYVLQGLQKEGAATLDPEDFVHFWNASQLEFVRRRYREVDSSEERMQDLRVLIPPPSEILNTGASVNGGEIFLMPQSIMFILSLCQKIVSTSSSGVVSPALCMPKSGCSQSRPLKRDQRNDIERNPFWSSTTDEPYHFITGNEVRTVVPDPFWTQSIVMEYMREPVSLVFIAPGDPANVDPELPPQVNQIIANDVVRSRLENIESGRVQTLPREQIISNSNNL